LAIRDGLTAVALFFAKNNNNISIYISKRTANRGCIVHFSIKKIKSVNLHLMLRLLGCRKSKSPGLVFDLPSDTKTVMKS
jgi:hypothetical protein